MIAGNRCERPVKSQEQNFVNITYNAFRYKRDQILRRKSVKGNRGRIGLPMGLNLYENYHFWQPILTSLGYEVVRAPFGSRDLFLEGQATIPSDTVCYPAKMMHGLSLIHIYQIGKGKSPVDAYLSIGEIIELAKAKAVDAIHPGYGFLSENAEFAKQCEEAGIAFIGPTHVMMDALGDKIQSKIVATSVGVPTIPGVEKAAENEDEVQEYAKVCGYPLILKASAGGGGRGMRIRCV